MNISTAVKKLEEGYRIRRDVWWDKYSLELRNNAIIMVSSVPTTHITSHNYIFAPSDLRANDWVEVSTKKYVVYKETCTLMTTPTTLSQAEEDKQRLLNEHNYTPPKGKGTTTFRIQEVTEE